MFPHVKTDARLLAPQTFVECDHMQLIHDSGERQLVGLTGVVKISHIIFNGASLLRFDGFAPAMVP